MYFLVVVMALAGVSFAVNFPYINGTVPKLAVQKLTEGHDGPEIHLLEPQVPYMMKKAQDKADSLKVEVGLPQSYFESSTVLDPVPEGTGTPIELATVTVTQTTTHYIEPSPQASTSAKAIHNTNSFDESVLQWVQNMFKKVVDESLNDKLLVKPIGESLETENGPITNVYPKSIDHQTYQSSTDSLSESQPATKLVEETQLYTILPIVPTPIGAIESVSASSLSPPPKPSTRDPNYKSGKDILNQKAPPHKIQVAPQFQFHESSPRANTNGIYGKPKVAWTVISSTSAAVATMSGASVDSVETNGYVTEDSDYIYEYIYQEQNPHSDPLTLFHGPKEIAEPPAPTTKPNVALPSPSTDKYNQFVQYPAGFRFLRKGQTPGFDYSATSRRNRSRHRSVKMENTASKSGGSFSVIAAVLLVSYVVWTS